MLFKVVAVLLMQLLFVALSSTSKIQFDNYRVYSVNVTNEEQLNNLQHLEQTMGWDFWRSARSVGQTADIMVAPHQAALFADIASALRVTPTLMVDDVQRLIDEEQPQSRASSNFGWENYYGLEEIYAWLDEQLEAYPTILTNLTVGQSFEKRTIRAVKLSHKTDNPTIFIESNIHAREWISSATATWLLNELLTSIDPAVQDLAQNFDWVIVPVFNVDGFAYSHRVNRMWRKTRQPHGHLCYGADPNRNFDSHWMEIGASKNICSETFAGPTVWSEPEAVALAEFVASMSGKIKLYLALHSYGQYFMFPLGHTSEPVPNYDSLMTIAEKFKEAAALRYGTNFRIGPSSTTIYETSGGSDDWAYTTQNIRLTYCVEFRDLGNYGFILPADQIVPNSLEFLDGLLAVVKEGRIQNEL